MKKEARHHHYLPQCYLKGFLPKQKESSNLSVIDKKSKKYFETSTRNIGGVRDFNRINVEGIAPDIIESNLSSFEGQVSSALRELHKEKSLDNKETYTVLMNLIALIGIRHPKMRNHWANFQAQVAKRIMAITLSSKDRWESTIRKMKQDGVEVDDNVSYEDMKKFFESDEYDIVVSNESHIDIEFEGIDAILPFLFNRGWMLVIASDETGPFITCDRPVSLTWQYPEKLPPIIRHSPGFGMKETEVVFPISQDMAVIGAFEIQNQVLNPKRDFVASINSRIMSFAVSQVYAPDLSFNFIDREGNMQSGNSIPNLW
jgi:hypothetical protein